MPQIISRILTSVILIFILYFTYIYNQLFYLLILIISFFSFVEFYKLIVKSYSNKNDQYLKLCYGLMYLFFTLFILIIKLQDLKNLIFYFILICVVTDIGGLIFGKLIKGKKLTKLSPNKTYAGFYGGFLFSLLILLTCYNYFETSFIVIALFTFSVCLLSQFGDLFFSFLKRKAKVKDTGNLLPGHGGILDRVDGIIISVPINILIYTISS